MILSNSFFLPEFPTNLTFPIYGILCPIIAILTLISNIIVVCVFMKRQMRSVTTVFLAGLAVSDTLSAALWSITHFFFYGIRDKTEEPLLYPDCIFHDFALYFAVIFHTTSVWLTLTLGLQRCVIVVKPFKGPRLWTIRKSTFIAVMAYLIPTIFFAPLFFMKNYFPFHFIADDNTTSVYCAVDVAQWFRNDMKPFSIIYYIFRGVFVQLLPCVLMMISTAVLAYKLRHERILQRHMSRIVDGQKRDFQRRQRTTLMVVIIMVIFMIVEIPTGIVFGIKFYEDTTNRLVLTREVDYPFAIFQNFLLLLSYHCNFWIYVGLSARFRRTLQNFCFGYSLKKTMEEVISLTTKSPHNSSDRSIRQTLVVNGNGHIYSER
ncbi:sex peptide receptor-like [Ylistrum balloti]|uniref:sex peptide receptor-like n=1 Tax=Ylistrum balloti TaxID=509963 RepID=UPI002905EAF7|nr:sex peptide receptor-like [Ylistrum balloti]